MIDAEDKKSIIESIELMLNDANWRSSAAHTEEEMFAYRVAELMKDCLLLVDKIHDDMETLIHNTNDEVDEAEYARDELADRLKKIRSIAVYGLED